MLLVVDLRRALEVMDDNLPIVIPGGEFGYTDATEVDAATVEWVTDDQGNEVDEPIRRCCVVIE